MFESQIDATYVWLGVAIVSLVTAGVAASLPAGPPPDAQGVAYTIDTVATGEYPATAEHGIAADELRLTTEAVSLKRGEETATTQLTAHRITPVSSERVDPRLQQVLSGIPPEMVFEEPAAFKAASDQARAQAGAWQPAPARLTVRHVQYGEVHVTLVG